MDTPRLAAHVRRSVVPRGRPRHTGQPPMVRGSRHATHRFASTRGEKSHDRAMVSDRKNRLSRASIVGLGALLVSMSAVPAVSASPEKPEAFVRRVYARYVNDGPGIQMARPDGTPFYAAVLLDAFATDSAGNASSIDWDPLCNCQTWEKLRIKSVAMAAEQSDSVKARLRRQSWIDHHGHADFVEDASRMADRRRRREGRGEHFGVVAGHEPASEPRCSAKRNGPLPAEALTVVGRRSEDPRGSPDPAVGVMRP